MLLPLNYYEEGPEPLEGSHCPQVVATQVSAIAESPAQRLTLMSPHFPRLPDLSHKGPGILPSQLRNGPFFSFVPQNIPAFISPISCAFPSRPQPSAADKSYISQLSPVTGLQHLLELRGSSRAGFYSQKTLCIAKHLYTLMSCVSSPPHAPQASHTSCFLHFLLDQPPQLRPCIHGSLPCSWEALTSLHSPKPPVSLRTVGPQTPSPCNFPIPRRANLCSNSCFSNTFDMSCK